MIRFAILAVALLLSGPALADFSAGLPAERVLPGEIDRLAGEVRRELAPGGSHAGLDAERRDAVESALTELSSLLAGRERIDELSPNQQLALLNAWQLANAALGPGAFDPVVCYRVIPTGSKLKETRCAHRSGTDERARIEHEAWQAALDAER
jgi:hypothetical protein